MATPIRERIRFAGSISVIGGFPCSEVVGADTVGVIRLFLFKSVLPAEGGRTAESRPHGTMAELIPATLWALSHDITLVLMRS